VPPSAQHGLSFVQKSVQELNRMPLQFYAPLKPPCRLCGAGFEHRQPASAADLTECPKCGQAVQRVSPQNVNSPKLSAPLSVSRARQAGFTVLKRTSAGEYERQ
jgi:putative FmdB family regulatory protein